MSGIESVSAGPAAPQAQAARPTRRRSRLRTFSAGICVMLLVQYGLGIGVNLYVQVPAADQGSGPAATLGRALTSQPAALAVHAAVGLLLLVAAINVLTHAILARHRRAIAACAAGLAAIIGAAVSGDMFVSSGHDGASMAMAIFTGVALLCYLASLLTTSTVAASDPGGDR